jgi:hypothetical protein
MLSVVLAKCHPLKVQCGLSCQGMCSDNSCNVFLLLFMILWVPISTTLFRRAVLMLWHAFVFLGLRFFLFLAFMFLFSSFRLVASAVFSCKKFLLALMTWAAVWYT